MKALVGTCLLTLAVAASAQTTPPPKSSARKSTKPAAVKTAPATMKEVEDLRGALAAQQQQMEQQRQQMDQLRSQLQQLIDHNQQAGANAQRSAEQAPATATQAQQTAAEAQRLADQASANAVEAKTALAVVDTATKDQSKRLSALSDLVGRFRFNGDIRIRGEALNQDCKTCQDRNRARIRLRFGLDGKLNEDFTGGFAFATGSLGEPTSTNESLTNFFDRKTIGLDKGYVTYNPVAHNWFSATGGKFAYQWQRTSVTGDPDINPEGFNIKASFDLHSPVVKNVTLQAINYLYSEATAGTNSYALGMQASTKLQFGFWNVTPSFLVLKWNNPDAIFNASAFAVQATTGATGVNTPGEGPGCAKGNGLPTNPPCTFSPQGMTNATTWMGPASRTSTPSGFTPT